MNKLQMIIRTLWNQKTIHNKKHVKEQSYFIRTALYSKKEIFFIVFQLLNIISSAPLAKLTTVLSKASKGCYNKEITHLFREAARTSIDSIMPAKTLELKKHCE